MRERRISASTCEVKGKAPGTRCSRAGGQSWPSGGPGWPEGGVYRMDPSFGVALGSSDIACGGWAASPGTHRPRALLTECPGHQSSDAQYPHATWHLLKAGRAPATVVIALPQRQCQFHRHFAGALISAVPRRELRHREVQELTQSHTAARGLGLALGRGPLSPDSTFLTTVLFIAVY